MYIIMSLVPEIHSSTANTHKYTHTDLKKKRQAQRHRCSDAVTAACAARELGQHPSSTGGAVSHRLPQLSDAPSPTRRAARDGGDTVQSLCRHSSAHPTLLCLSCRTAGGCRRGVQRCVPPQSLLSPWNTHSLSLAYSHRCTVTPTGTRMNAHIRAHTLWKAHSMLGKDVHVVVTPLLLQGPCCGTTA